MRCPKCGYISFDRQKSCSRCSNDLTAVAEQLQGTVGKNAAPFFLGAVLGKREAAVAEPGPALHAEEEALDLNELEGQALPAEEEELDFTGPLLDESNLAEQTPLSLGLEDIDVSDLMSLEEDESPAQAMESEEEEDSRATPSAREEHSLMGDIELPSLSPDEESNFVEPGSLLAGVEDEETEPSTAADEGIIDLSSLMDFAEAPESTTDRGKSGDVMDLSFDEESDALHAGPEDGKKASAEVGKTPAGAGGDIADSGLTLENDEQ